MNQDEPSLIIEAPKLSLSPIRIYEGGGGYYVKLLLYHRPQLSYTLYDGYRDNSKSPPQIASIFASSVINKVPHSPQNLKTRTVIKFV